MALPYLMKGWIRMWEGIIYHRNTYRIETKNPTEKVKLYRVRKLVMLFLNLISCTTQTNDRDSNTRIRMPATQWKIRINSALKGHLQAWAAKLHFHILFSNNPVGPKAFHYDGMCGEAEQPFWWTNTFNKTSQTQWISHRGYSQCGII